MKGIVVNLALLTFFGNCFGLFGKIAGPSHCCKMGNDKNKKKRQSRNPRGAKTKLAGMSTPKQNPTYPHTRSVTRTQHIHNALLATTTVPSGNKPQEVVSTLNLLPDVTIFGPTNLQDLQGTHTVLNLRDSAHYQSLEVAQTPHERAEMEILLDDSEADDGSDGDMFVEPSTAIWAPEANRAASGGLEEDESAVFVQTPQVCSYQPNPESVPELLTVSHAPAPVNTHSLKKVSRAWAKKRVAVVEEEVQEGSGELHPQSVTMH